MKIPSHDADLVSKVNILVVPFGVKITDVHVVSDAVVVVRVIISDNEEYSEWVDRRTNQCENISSIAHKIISEIQWT